MIDPSGRVAGWWQTNIDSLSALIRSFATGAVVASLATEVFPEEFREHRQVSGLAAAGVVASVSGQPDG